MTEGNSVAHRTDAAVRRPRISRLFQIRLSRLMILIAVGAVVCSAWSYHHQNRNDQQAWTSSQIVALSDPDSARRRQGAENLYRVEADNLTRTVAVLAGALSDTYW